MKMRKKMMLLLLLIATTSAVFAQETVELTEKMRLQMPPGGGSNGATVAWNPQKKLYYAAFAGNENFPMAVFDAKGTRISDDEMTTSADLRGLWFNKKNGKLEANGYGDIGMLAYELDEKGMPTTVKIEKKGLNAPGDNSVGAFHSSQGLPMFLDVNIAYLYKDGIVEMTIPLNSDEDEAYSTTAICFEEKSGLIGMLKLLKNTVDFFDIEGNKKMVWQLPTDAPLSESFNFGYANELIWLFDTENRVWIGYGK